VTPAGRENYMTIAEPMTLFTDYLLAAVVFVLAVRLSGHYRHCRRSPVRWWAAGFYASAAAALLGGSYHGFLPHLDAFPAMLLWKATVLSVGMAALCLFAGAVVAALRGAPRRWFLALAWLKFLIYAAWMSRHDDFRFVIYDYAPALLGIFLLSLYAALARRAPAAPWIVAGVIVSFAAAGVQASGFSLHTHFNHNDLYHVVQMGAFWLLYRGGRQLSEA